MSSTIPSDAECIELLKDAGCKRRVIIHCCTVNAVAQEMLTRIDADRALVTAGALLHDIGRSVDHSIMHAYIGSQIVAAHGLPPALVDIRPGFVRTDLLNDGKRYPALMSPAYVARQIARAIDRKKRRAIIDGRYALLVFLWRLIPAWLWERLPIRN